jgi:hypothetical protein
MAKLSILVEPIYFVYKINSANRCSSMPEKNDSREDAMLTIVRSDPARHIGVSHVAAPLGKGV